MCPLLSMYQFSTKNQTPPFYWRGLFFFFFFPAFFAFFLAIFFKKINLRTRVRPNSFFISLINFKTLPRANQLWITLRKKILIKEKIFYTTRNEPRLHSFNYCRFFHGFVRYCHFKKLELFFSRKPDLLFGDFAYFMARRDYRFLIHQQGFPFVFSTSQIFY